MGLRAIVEGRTADGTVLNLIAIELAQMEKLTAEVVNLEAACGAYEATVGALHKALTERGHNPAGIFDDAGQLIPDKIRAALVDLHAAAPAQPRPRA
jgi:hypothetical protein